MVEFREIRKINKHILKLVFARLDIKLEVENRKKLIDLISYMKLRYFFLDKKCSQEEVIKLIASILDYN